jgi:hypothetical protein
MSKDFTKVSSYPRLLVAGFIFLFATCSFFGNSFSAADPSWFTQHQLDSEQLVLDGIPRPIVTLEIATRMVSSIATVRSMVYR